MAVKTDKSHTKKQNLYYDALKVNYKSHNYTKMAVIILKKNLSKLSV